MATGKKKFQIPTASEMEDVTSSPLFKPQDTLNAFKRQQQEEETSENSEKKLDVTMKSTSTGKELPSNVTNISLKDNNVNQKESAIDSLAVNQKEIAIDCVAGPSKKSSKEENVPTILPASKTTGKSSSLIVNPRQRGNPILKFIRNVPWEFGEIVPDYLMGVSTCALYLSLRYHQLNPNYIHDRLKQLGRGYDLRVMLVQIDIKEPHHLVKDLAKICILTDCTLILAFSPDEAGRYLETFKVYEFKPPEAIMEKTDQNYLSKLTECLTTVKSVNKTDAMTLLSAFDTMEGIMNTSTDDLSLCPGFGPQKAKRLHDIFQEPFIKSKKSKTVESLSKPGTSSSGNNKDT